MLTQNKSGPLHSHLLKLTEYVRSLAPCSAVCKWQDAEGKYVRCVGHLFKHGPWQYHQQQFGIMGFLDCYSVAPYAYLNACKEEELMARYWETIKAWVQKTLPGERMNYWSGNFEEIPSIVGCSVWVPLTSYLQECQLSTQ